MPGTFVNQGIGDTFAFPFKDPKWAEKMLIAALLVLANFVIPIIPAFFLAGYALLVIRRIVLDNGNSELPAWRDWGRLFVDGARLFGIAILYMLPVLLLGLLGVGLMFLPTLLVGPIGIEGDEISDLLALIPVLASLGGVIVLGFVTLLGIFLGLMLPLASVHFAVKERFAAAFHFGEWWRVVRSNFTDFLIAYAIIMVVSIISGLVTQLLSLTVILCLFIPILQSVVSVYVLLLSSALFAQAYRVGVEKTEDQQPNLTLEESK